MKSKMIMNIHNNNYLNIQGWMRTKLGLSGNQLIAYALVYGFSQDGKSEFTGSLQYISDWIGCSRRTAIRIMQDLTESELLIREDYSVNNISYVKYTVNLDIIRGGENLSPLVTKLHRGGDKHDRKGGEILSPNNKRINNKDIIKENISDSKDLDGDALRENTFQLNGPIYMQHVQMSLKREGLSVDDAEYKVNVKKFINEMIGTGEYNKPIHELKKRFYYWLRKKVEVKAGKRNDRVQPTQAVGPAYKRMFS